MDLVICCLAMENRTKPLDNSLGQLTLIFLPIGWDRDLGHQLVTLLLLDHLRPAALTHRLESDSRQIELEGAPRLNNWGRM